MHNHRRFLRARDFNVDDTLQKYRATQTWREENRILELYENIEARHYEETRKVVSTSSSNSMYLTDFTPSIPIGLVAATRTASRAAGLKSNN